jgi:hypothetical protein
LTLWLNRRKPWENSANPAEADSSELGYELDEGPDEIAETAIRVASNIPSDILISNLNIVENNSIGYVIGTLSVVA